MSGDTSRRYPPELKARAVRMVAEVRADHGSEWAAMAKVAQLLGVTAPESVRTWVRQAEVHGGDTGQHDKPRESQPEGGMRFTSQTGQRHPKR